MISSEWNAATNRPGISLTKPLSAATAPLNQANARGTAFVFCIVAHSSCSPMKIMNAPISASASCGAASPVIGSLPITAHSSG